MKSLHFVQSLTKDIVTCPVLSVVFVQRLSQGCFQDTQLSKDLNWATKVFKVSEDKSSLRKQYSQFSEPHKPETSFGRYQSVTGLADFLHLSEFAG